MQPSYQTIAPCLFHHFPVQVGRAVNTQSRPLLLLEFFKILSAAAAFVTVLAIRQRLHRYASQQVKLATIMGVISVVLLLTAGVVGAIAIALATPSDGA